MQIFSIGDILDETSQYIFKGKYQKYFKMSSAENFMQHAEY